MRFHACILLLSLIFTPLTSHADWNNLGKIEELTLEALRPNCAYRVKNVQAYEASGTIYQHIQYFQFTDFRRWEYIGLTEPQTSVRRVIEPPQLVSFFHAGIVVDGGLSSQEVLELYRDTENPLVTAAMQMTVDPNFPPESGIRLAAGFAKFQEGFPEPIYSWFTLNPAEFTLESRCPQLVERFGLATGQD